MRIEKVGLCAVIAMSTLLAAVPSSGSGSARPAVPCEVTGVGPGLSCSPPPISEPTVTPIATPTPVPGPRTPTSTDYQQIQAISGFSQSQLEFVVIVGNYCYFGWSTEYVGGVYLATNTSGSWALIGHDHGGFNSGDLLTIAPQRGSAVAQELVNGAASQAP